MATIDDAAITTRTVPAMSAPNPEAELVDRARRGDHDAFAALVEARLGSTFRSALAILGHEADARDATQAIFLSAWTNLPRLREPDRFAAWFGRIVVNTCRSTIRGRQRRLVREVQVSRMIDQGEALPARTTPHEDRSADLDVLERAIRRLTDDERIVLWLHHYEDLSLAELSDRIGVPVTTVKSRLFTARRSLQRALEIEAS